jgi:hypothetical protein
LSPPGETQSDAPFGTRSSPSFRLLNCLESAFFFYDLCGDQLNIYGSFSYFIYQYSWSSFLSCNVDSLEVYWEEVQCHLTILSHECLLYVLVLATIHRCTLCNGSFVLPSVSSTCISKPILFLNIALLYTPTDNLFSSSKQNGYSTTVVSVLRKQNRCTSEFQARGFAILSLPEQVHFQNSCLVLTHGPP